MVLLHDGNDLEVGRRAPALRLSGLRPVGRAGEFDAVPTLSSATLVADEHPVATTNKAVVAAASQARIDAAGQRRRPSRSMSER